MVGGNAVRPRAVRLVRQTLPFSGSRGSSDRLSRCTTRGRCVDRAVWWVRSLNSSQIPLFAFRVRPGAHPDLTVGCACAPGRRFAMSLGHSLDSLLLEPTGRGRSTSHAVVHASRNICGFGKPPIGVSSPESFGSWPCGSPFVHCWAGSPGVRAFPVVRRSGMCLLYASPSRLRFVAGPFLSEPLSFHGGCVLAGSLILLPTVSPLAFVYSPALGPFRCSGWSLSSYLC